MVITCVSAFGRMFSSDNCVSVGGIIVDCVVCVSGMSDVCVDCL